MSEPAFFAKPSPLTVGEVAELTGARIERGGDPRRSIDGVAPLDAARPSDVTFFESIRLQDLLSLTHAGACFCLEKHVEMVPADTVALVTTGPHRAFATLAARLYPTASRPQPITGIAGVSPAAVVHPTAVIEAGATIEAGAIIGPGAEIGTGTLVSPGAVVGPGVRIGRNGAVAAGATVTNALIGNRVVIHPGARVGQDGFGYIPGEAGHQKIPQIGRVIIQDDVEIGANTTIDRGSNRDTIVGEGTKIDNLVQIAHNVVIGRHCIIAGQVGISGSVTIGDFVMLGGNAGIRDNLTIGTGARIAAAAAVHSNIPAGETWGGYPALRVDKWRRQMRAFNRLAARGPSDKDAPDGQ